MNPATFGCIRTRSPGCAAAVLTRRLPESTWHTADMFVIRFSLMIEPKKSSDVGAEWERMGVLCQNTIAPCTLSVSNLMH